MLPEKTNASDRDELGGTVKVRVTKVSQGIEAVASKAVINPGRADTPELTELHQAIAAKSLKEVRAILRKGVDVNALHCNFDWGFPLSHAFEVGDIRIIRALLEAGADPNREDYLAGCIEDNKLSQAKLLVAHGADLKGQPTWEKDEEFETNLIRATRLGRHAFVKLLLEAGADPNLHDGNNESALFVARMAKNRRLMKLIEPYVSDDERSWVKERFSEAYAERVRLDGEIHAAIHAGQVDKVMELLSRPDSALDRILEPEFGSPLEEALNAYAAALNKTRPKKKWIDLKDWQTDNDPDYGHPTVVSARRMVDVLLELGAPVDKGGWVLPLAAVSLISDDAPDIDLGFRLLERASDVNIPVTCEGQTLLMGVARNRSVVFTKALLDRGADPNAHDNYGRSVLQTVRELEQYHGPNSCVPLLLEAGAKD